MKTKLILIIAGIVRFETEFYIPEYPKASFQDRTELRKIFITRQVLIMKERYYKQILKHKNYCIFMQVESKIKDIEINL